MKLSPGDRNASGGKGRVRVRRGTERPEGKVGVSSHYLDILSLSPVGFFVSDHTDPPLGGDLWMGGQYVVVGIQLHTCTNVWSFTSYAEKNVYKNPPPP